MMKSKPTTTCIAGIYSRLTTRLDYVHLAAGNMNFYVDEGGHSSNGKLVPAELLLLMAKYTLPFINKSVKSCSN